MNRFTALPLLLAAAAAATLSAGPLDLLNNPAFNLGPTLWTISAGPLSNLGSCVLATCTLTSNPALQTSGTLSFTTTYTQSVAVPAGVPITYAQLSYLSTATGAPGAIVEFDISTQLYSGTTLLFSSPQVLMPDSSGNVPWTQTALDLTSLIAAHTGETLQIKLVSTLVLNTQANLTGVGNSFDNVQLGINVVPEPPTVVLMASVLGLGALWQRRKWLGKAAQFRRRVTLKA